MSSSTTLDVLDKDGQIYLPFLTIQTPSFPLMVHYRSSSIPRLIHWYGPISFILYSIGTITDLSATTGDHSSKIATHDEEIADIQAKLDLLTSEVRTQYHLRQKQILQACFFSHSCLYEKYWEDTICIYVKFKNCSKTMTLFGFHNSYKYFITNAAQK